MRVCAEPGCEAKHHARGYCTRHYRLHAPPPDPGKFRRTERERFDDKFIVDSVTGCWLWQAHITKHGYGHFGTVRPDGTWGPRRAHRVAYELYVGPIPEELHLDHLCEVRHCVNPQHLKPVTPKVNTLRNSSPAADNARATVCRQGHPLEGANLQVVNAASGKRRRCKTCARARRLSEPGAAG